MKFHETVLVFISLFLLHRLTLKEGSILNDENFELSTGGLET